jgi:hypothetical protein
MILFQPLPIPAAGLYEALLRRQVQTGRQR